jgi:hypothetical protein
VFNDVEFTIAGLSIMSPVPDAGPNVNVKLSPLIMLAVEEGLPFVTVMNKLDCWPAGKVPGDTLTTGVMAVAVCADAVLVRNIVSPRTTANNRLILIRYTMSCVLVFICSSPLELSTSSRLSVFVFQSTGGPRQTDVYRTARCGFSAAVSVW